MHSTNQIDHHYFWKETIDILDFLHEDNHQVKVGSATIAFCRVWPVVPLIQSYSRIL